MKKKDIVILIIATAIIIVSIYFGYKLINPKPKNTNQTTEADKIKSIPTQIDEKTYERIKSLSDYGKPTLENIGKADLFSEGSGGFVNTVITTPVETTKSSSSTPPPIVCSYTTGSDGKQMLPSACNFVADGRTITQ